MEEADYQEYLRESFEEDEKRRQQRGQSMLETPISIVAGAGTTVEGDGKTFVIGKTSDAGL